MPDPEDNNLPEVTPPTVIGDEIKTGPLYRSEANQLLPLPGSEKTVHRQAMPQEEYVAGGPFYLAAVYLRSLAFAIDDVTADFGDDLYDRMMLDGQVASDVHTAKMAVLADGIQILPAVERWQVDEQTGDRNEHPDWQIAKEIADFVQRQFEGCVQAYSPDTTNTLYNSIYNLLDGVSMGNKVAEKIFELADEGEDAGRLCLKCLKVKPRHSAAFVVDPYKNVVGILALVPGQAMPVLVQSIMGDPNQIPNLLPRRKFCCFTFRPKDADPRGQSILRPAYDAWFVKQQIKIERLAYLARFTGGGVIGYTAEEAQPAPALNPDGSPILDAYGNPLLISPETVMMTSLLQWKNGAVACFPHGATVQVEYPQPANPFDAALDRQDREISKAILGTTRATMEAEHGSKADAQVGQDVAGLLVQHGKTCLETCLRFDVVRDLVEFNWGRKALSLLPKVSLSKTERQDFPTAGTTVSALYQAGYFTDNQLPEVDVMLGLPARSQGEASVVPAPVQAQLQAKQSVSGSGDAESGAAAAGSASKAAQPQANTDH